MLWSVKVSRNVDLKPYLLIKSCENNTLSSFKMSLICTMPRFYQAFQYSIFSFNVISWFNHRYCVTVSMVFSDSSLKWDMKIECMSLYVLFKNLWLAEKKGLRFLHLKQDCGKSLELAWAWCINLFIQVNLFLIVSKWHSFTLLYYSSWINVDSENFHPREHFALSYLFEQLALYQRFNCTSQIN